MDIIRKAKYKRSERVLRRKGLAYFRSLISQWSTEESALDHNFIANEDSLDEEEESSSEAVANTQR